MFEARLMGEILGVLKSTKVFDNLRLPSKFMFDFGSFDTFIMSRQEIGNVERLPESLNYFHFLKRNLKGLHIFQGLEDIYVKVL